MQKINAIHYRKLAKIFELAGFQKVREKGDHMVYIKQGIIRPIVIPKYNKIPVFIIKNNLRTAQIKREDYFEFLQQI